jgi:uncharacterized phage-like protein YoqJ
MNYTACFTGHRKISGSFYNHNNPTEEWLSLKGYLYEVIDSFYKNGVRTFISGMAIGVDTAAAETVLLFKPTHPDIRLVAAIPFPSQANKWPQASKDNYNHILSRADGIYTVNEDPYTGWKMIARDKYMVDQSQYTIAVWDGRNDGGTFHTVSYAQQQSRQIFRVEPNPIRGYWLGES